MSDQPKMSAATKELLKKVRMMVPPMLEKFHKGQLGRVAVIGGSENYTGAPYFSAMASARLGADLSHVICTPPAANVIKTYSPNLMVHPIMREIGEVPASHEPASELASPIIAMLSNLHTVVIGPGLGRDKLMQATVAAVIKAAREHNTPLVLDADALWLIQNQPDLIHGYKECVLTPNVVEFGRLAKAVGIGEDEMPDTGEAGCKKVAAALGGVLILRKGPVDWISDGSISVKCEQEGGRKRSGGQGDTLTGSIGTLLAYRRLYLEGLWGG
ncbi:hypothetical protein ABVK25_001299 [Lepraria finkii]|uniref:ATP-dependent (S)-NAD(P)H-hydrate dehydratase n=1 Tax=Lepraria finkii TaxID=1340010 RepID=A0ABR4BL92_9LECA